MLGVFAEVILPVGLVAGLGAWAGRSAEVPTRAMSRLTFALFTPALVFDSLVGIQAEPELVLRIVAVVVAGFLAMAVAGLGLATGMRKERPAVAATMLCSALANMGNMGLPVARLAFGPPGLETAVVAFVASSALMFSAGVGIAALADGSLRSALKAPLGAPALWAAAAALSVNMLGLPLPAALSSTAETLGAAAIPAMLVVLGMQVTERIPKVAELREALGAAGLRLIVGPAAAAGASVLAGLGGVQARTLIVLGGMPTAVAATILANHYGAQPALVTRAVVLSTLGSVLTLTVLVSVLAR